MGWVCGCGIDVSDVEMIEIDKGVWLLYKV